MSVWGLRCQGVEHDLRGQRQRVEGPEAYIGLKRSCGGFRLQQCRVKGLCIFWQVRAGL